VLLVNSGRLAFDGPVSDLEENGTIEEAFYRLTNHGAPPPPSEPAAESIEGQQP